MIEDQIRKTQTKLSTAKQAVEKFSDALQAAALDRTRNLMEVCKALLEEKDKAAVLVEKLDVELRELEHKKIVAKDKFENSTLPDFLKRMVTHFDRMPDTEKKRIRLFVI
jgi:hypothetical protein